MARQEVDADSIRAAVDSFYERVLGDPALAGLFANVDMPRLRSHQRHFLIQVLGGPSRYTGRQLKDAHAPFPIDDAAFDATVVHLIASLRDAGVGADVVDRAAKDVERLRPVIVG